VEGTLAIPALTALWMGVLATVSPCPMGTNVAAVSIIAAGGGKRPRSALLTAAAYGAGRTLVHALLGMLIVRGIATATGATAAMQAIPGKFSGPVFIVLGVLLSGWIELPMPRSAASARKKILGDKPAGPAQTFAVGCVFSLIPCPETAALFFGGMIPLAVETGSAWLLPLLFGLGTGLPVMLIGYLLSLGIGKFANSLGQIRRAEPALRALTCLAFVGIGLFLTLCHVYHVL
jgi:cytochrome c biogenesis protein CcdA